jgi:Tfp pilus assembly protein PilF
LTSKSPAWRVRAIQVTLEIPDPQEAQAWLEHLDGVTPEDGLAERVMIAEVYESIGRRSNDKALIQKGFEKIQRAAAHPRATAITFLAAGAQAERVGDMSAAEAFYRRALGMDPNLWVAHNNLAMLIYRRGGDAKEAMEHASAALKLQPYNASVNDTYAQIALKSGDFKQAAASMRESTKLDPDSPKWRIRLARYLMDGGNAAEAARIVDDIDARRLDLRNLTPELRQQLEEVRKQVKGTRPKAA